MMKLIVSTLGGLFGLLMFASSWGAERLPVKESITPTKTCVEVRKDIKSCFETTAAYSAWKNCVNSGSDPVKCYLKPMGPALPVRPARPDGRHFQFDYVIRYLSSKEVADLQAGRTKLIDVVDGELCRFKGEDFASIRPDLKLKDRGTVKDMEFDIRGRSSGCSDDKATWLEAQIENYRPTMAGLPGLDNPPIPRVIAGNRNYLLDWGEQRVMDFTWDSFNGNVAEGTFEFLAKQYQGEAYLIAIFGYYSLEDEGL
jgi:hypothetical protein